MRRPLFFFAISAAVGCGIAFSPGDYSAPGENNDSGPSAADTGPIVDTTPEASTEAGPTAPSLHLLLFTGVKDTGGANDVWVAPVNDAGDLGAFGYLQPTPLLSPFQALGVANGKVLSVVQGSSARVVQSADFDGGIASGWATTTVANAPTGGYGSFFAKASVVVVGGQTSEQVDDGTGTGGTITVTTNHPELFVSKADGGVYPAPNNVTSPTKLPAGVVNVTSVVYKDFVYLWAGGDKGAQGKIFVGKIDEAAGLGSVTPTTPIVAQGDTPTSAIACAGEGRLFVVNGDATMTADIDEASGALGAFKTGAVLPAARSAAGCAVVRGWLYLFGGRLADKKLTSDILRSKIGADGTLSKWETTAQTLIAPRANVFALTY